MKNILFGHMTIMRLAALLLAASFIPGAAGAQTPGGKTEASTTSQTEAVGEPTRIIMQPTGFAIVRTTGDGRPKTDDPRRMTEDVRPRELLETSCVKAEPFCSARVRKTGLISFFQGSTS
jgi:hypothetical protein